jgi:uncharacterized Ntn-hydrolase superfamily protein
VTFSLVGQCGRTGMFGAIVTSSSPAVAARCAWARARVGAACTQNITDPTLGNKMLDALQEGCTAQEALERVLRDAPHPQYRQLTLVDSVGRSAEHSGSQTLGVNRVVQREGVVAAGNLLSSERVPDAMVDAFLAQPETQIGDRLLAALKAGDEAGGEEGPVRSCGMVIVDKVAWPVSDLRVDWSDDPIAELTAVWEIWKPQAEDYVVRAVHPDGAPSFGVPGDE